MATERIKDLRFGVETQTGRVSDVAGTGTVDTSIRNRQLLKGLSDLSTSLASFAVTTEKRQIQNDIITARTAFAVNKELPGGLAPEAELAYDTLVAKKNTNQFFRILTDDAEVFGTGVLTDDENYPDHNAKQLAFEDYIDGSVKTFFDQAQFSDAQQAAILETITQNKDRLKQDFTLIAAKDIKAQKLNDTAEFVQENILQQINSIKYLKEFDAANAHLTLDQFFTDQWHTDLQKEILEANPWLTKDEADLTIIQQLELLATDPDNPQPDVLDYLDQKRAGGKPRFTSIKGLREKIRTAQRQAESALITKHNADTKRENRIQKEKEELAEEGAMQHMVSVVHETEDPVKLEKKIKSLFPDITSKALRATVNHFNTLKANNPGNTAITARLIQEASRGALDNIGFEGDPRSKLISRDQLLQVYGEISKFKMGQVTRNRKRINDSIDDFRLGIENRLQSRGELTLPTGSYTTDITDLIFSDATNRWIGFDPKTNSIIDNLVSEYETAVYAILDDPDNMDINDLQKELLKNKENFYKRLGMLGGEPKPVEAGQPSTFDFGAAFDREVAEDLAKPMETPLDIIKGTAPVYTGFKPRVHIPPPKPMEQLKISQNFKKNRSVMEKLKSNVLTPTKKNEQDTSVSRDIPTDRLGDIKPTPLKETQQPLMGTPEQRQQAFEQAMPDKPPTERVKLRELQDKAEFQDDRTIFDFVKEQFKKLKGLPADLHAEVVKEFPKEELDAVVFLVEQEGFSRVAEDVGDGEVTAGIGITKTGRQLGEKVSTKDAVKELKQRLIKNEIPYVKDKIIPQLPFKPTRNQEVTLISLIFNIGQGAFKKSQAFKALKKGDINTFKKEAFDKNIGFVKIRNPKTGKKEFSQGLYNRRQRELKLWDK